MAKDSFHSLSQEAALAERKTDMVSAFELWKQASLLCKVPDNIKWCIDRAMFCEAFINRNSKRKIQNI
ncbi:ANR family transcriptional regulator [Escherichia coli]|uniref:ANR family transcriptional regulator n=1 Tax=Escherichia coli TaxID=562 RepID=UPI0003EF616B|nr:ANR family transcriptional regulator [Escherichia coli]